MYPHSPARGDGEFGKFYVPSPLVGEGNTEKVRGMYNNRKTGKKFIFLKKQVFL